MQRIAYCSVLVLLLLLPPFARAENALAADFRKEGTALKSDCGDIKKFFSCGEDLFTDHPLHIALGSMPPQNGFGVGLAFVAHKTIVEQGASPTDANRNSWRLNWDVDAVGSNNGSWRVGGYMTAVFIPKRKISVSFGGSGQPSNIKVTEYPVFHLYAQDISLNKLLYFGLGDNTKDTDRSYFGMREGITGVNAIWPIFPKLNASLLGEANGRFVDIRGDHSETSPSIEQLYSPATAPGLNGHTGFAQFGQGIRLRPVFAADYIRLNYLVMYQEFLGGSSSFRRFTTDFSHQFALYSKTRTALPRDFNGPDDCSEDPRNADPHPCPAITRNLEGSIGLRFLMVQSIVPAGNSVPFYFQPTLGGSDINGNLMLPSYQDYRFRAPNMLLARASFEHSIYKWPIGLSLMYDTGKVALRRGDLDFSHLQHSYAAGLTLRAGGFPLVYLLFAWGGHEGTHTIGSMNTSLLGGSTRPSLY